MNLSARIDWWRRYWRQRRADLAAGRKVQPHREPRFLLGNQKSGTSAVAGTLAAFAGMPVTLDVTDPQQAAKLLEIRDAAGLRRFVTANRLAFSRPLIKEPNLTFLVPQLRQLFPTARFVLIIRDPRDNIRSVLNRLKLPGTLSSPPREDLGRTWRGVLMSRHLGITTDNPIEAQALRWRKAIDVHLADPQRLPVVRYEDFLSNKPRFAAELAQRFEFRPGGAPDAVAAAAGKRYQPRGMPVPWPAFFGDDNLRRINDTCGDYLERFGYDRDALEAVHASQAVTAATRPETMPEPSVPTATPTQARL